MKKSKKFLTFGAACAVIFFAACKNETKTAASTESNNTNVVQTTSGNAKAMADSIAAAETAARMSAKEDSIAKAVAALETPSKAKGEKSVTKEVTKPTSKTSTTASLPKKSIKPAVPMPTKKNDNWV